MWISRVQPVLAALSLVALGGCVSSPVVAPAESQIFISASETTIVLDEFSTPAVTSDSTLITAQVLSSTGVPQSDVDVVFTTSGGALASQPDNQPSVTLRTDDEGLVSDTLTLQLGDPSSVTVTARSGTLSNSIEILKTETPFNQLPFAVLDSDVGAAALVDRAVEYNGSASADPDGDPITCFQFHIETSEDMQQQDRACPSPSNRCEITQSALPVIDRTWAQEMLNVRVRLRVSDDPTLECGLGDPTLPFSAFNGLATLSHSVVCDRFMPMANAGINRLASRRCAASGLVCTSDATCDTVANPGDVCLSTFFATLDGAGSSGGDSGILEYRWSCGSGEVTCPSNPLATGTDFGPRCSTFGSAPPDENCCGPSGSEVTCVYPTAVSDDSFMVELQVVNGCQTLSGTDMTTVTIP